MCDIQVNDEGLVIDWGMVTCAYVLGAGGAVWGEVRWLVDLYQRGVMLAHEFQERLSDLAVSTVLTPNDAQVV